MASRVVPNFVDEGRISKRMDAGADRCGGDAPVVNNQCVAEYLEDADLTGPLRRVLQADRPNRCHQPRIDNHSGPYHAGLDS